MSIARHAVETNAPPESVWRCWVDLAGWPAWDRSLESASLAGPFQAGSVGRLVFQDGRRLDFRIGPVEPGRSFTLESRLPGARIRMDHRLEPSAHGSRIIREVAMDGWLAWLHQRRIGAALQEALPPALRGLARSAERPR